MPQFHFPSYSEPPAIKANILYWVLNRPAPGLSYAKHYHPFWQIEIIQAGKLEMGVDGETITLQAEDIVFIPPFLEHSLHYPSAGIAYCSVKLDVEGLVDSNRSNRIVKLAEPAFLYHDLEALLGNVRQVTPAKLIIATNLLSALLTIHYTPCTGTAKDLETPLRRSVQDLITQNSGSILSAEEIARRLGYSCNYLSALFHREAGQTLKSFIDRMVCHNAQKLIIHSAMNINEIGDALGFNSVYSFSRFFKRITGRSPTDFRHHTLHSGGVDR